MANIGVKTLTSQQNPVLTFLTRMKEDRAKGLRPAGQVYPPPTKEEGATPVPHEIPAGYS